MNSLFDTDYNSVGH